MMDLMMSMIDTILAHYMLSGLMLVVALVCHFMLVAPLLSIRYYVR